MKSRRQGVRNHSIIGDVSLSEMQVNLGIFLSALSPDCSYFDIIYDRIL